MKTTFRSVAQRWSIMLIATSVTLAATEEIIPLLQFEHAPLPDAIKTLARHSGLNVVLDPHVPGSGFDPGGTLTVPKVNCRLTNITAGTALRLIAREHALTLVTNPATTVIRIAPERLRVSPVPAGAVGTNTDDPIPRLKLTSVSLTNAIALIAKEAHLQVAFSPEVADPSFHARGTVSLDWEHLTWRQALAALLDNYGLALTEELSGSSVLIRLNRKEGNR